jgi:hypothetical protein
VAPRIEVLEDVDTRLSAARLPPLAPTRVAFDLSRLAQPLRSMIWALPAVDAIYDRWPGAWFSVRTGAPEALLLSAHLAARGAKTGPGPVKQPLLTIVLGPSESAAPKVTRTGRHSTLALPPAFFPWRPHHGAGHWVDSVRAAGFVTEGRAPSLELPRRARADARRFMRLHFGRMSGPVVALVSNAGLGETWGQASLERLLHQLENSMGARGLAVGLSVPGAVSVPSFAGPELVAALLSLCSAAVGDDADWAHVAAATHLPVLTLHGAASPPEAGPCSPRATALWAQGGTCPACQALEKPPARCLSCIPIERVAAAAEQALAQRWPWDLLARWVP